MTEHVYIESILCLHPPYNGDNITIVYVSLPSLKYRLVKEYMQDGVKVSKPITAYTTERLEADRWMRDYLRGELKTIASEYYT